MQKKETDDEMLNRIAQQKHMIDQSQKLKSDLHQREAPVNYQMYHRCQQVNNQVVAKINQNMKTQNRNMSQKENKVDRQIINQMRKETLDINQKRGPFIEKDATNKDKPKHDTEWIIANQKPTWNKNTQGIYS